MKTVFQEKVLELMRRNDLSIAKLSRLSGIPASTISGFLLGKFHPKQDKILKLAQVFNVEPTYLENNIISSTKTNVKIPVLGHVAANPDGTPAIENVIDYVEISESLARRGDHFALLVKGDSMEPYIYEGDIVIVRKQTTANTGELVIALIDGENATCKKLIKSKDGISLVSFNSKYEPRTFSNKQIEELPVIILGRVVESRQKC